MASRDSEPRRSMGPPMSVKAVTADGVQANKRGPNPQTDYKRHFNRTKERFDLVTADQTARKKELDRASMKQAKLQEELEYLLDAVAGEQRLARHLRTGRRTSPTETAYHFREQQGSAPSATTVHESARAMKRQRPSPTNTDDELLETAGLPAKRFRDD